MTISLFRISLIYHLSFDKSIPKLLFDLIVIPNQVIICLYKLIQQYYLTALLSAPKNGGEIMKLKVSKESASGLNTEFVNVETGRHIPLEQAVTQIIKGNKNYENYQVVNKSDGTTYIRSKADGIKKNNIEE